MPVDIAAILTAKLPTFYCPTRRSGVAVPWNPAFIAVMNNVSPPAGILVGKTDYGANAGSLLAANSATQTGLRTAGASRGPAANTPADIALFFSASGTNCQTNLPCATGHDGIVQQISKVRVNDVLDGTSNTYMLGEKMMRTEFYELGTDNADDGPIFEGFDDDLLRWSGRATSNATGQILSVAEMPPVPDTPRLLATVSGVYGSAHPGAFGAAFCDGSVRRVSYRISGETHRRLGGRKDGLSLSSDF
jgi:prepilin-type processing-associated H-X9-DG protein